MSAVEEIEAAIASLTELQASASSPLNVYGRDWRVVVVGEPEDDDAPILFDLANAGQRADSYLIVTLHRTINAQLALLEAAKFNISMAANGYTHATVAAAIRLAQVINGQTDGK